MTPARYFPVKPGAKMSAGLMPFGRDFGNGATDRRYFQFDDQRAHYLAEKRALDQTGEPRYRRHGWLTETARQRSAHQAVLAWLQATLAREHPDLAHFGRGDEDYLSPYDEWVRNLQEDMVVIQRGHGEDRLGGDGNGHAGDPMRASRGDRVIMAHVCFPSDWRSDEVLGWDFQRIHRPVPGFAEHAAAAASMVAAMIERGPYVRFVWSLCADDNLDHHPDLGLHLDWDEAEEFGGPIGWVRVERQVTVPFPDHDAAAFLIRTYLYPFSSLSRDERALVADAVERMPAEVARYKGLEPHRARIRRVLARSGPS
ncbi:heme-dependent oxidative N-demethylase subunit alpha family protein [Haliangium sp.]|uniref:heme-dependent oxidative N-demethylase subunit alpha family protein n=1 Tax=Haliangium sp. TaxID=2663208 RepID=UPI003D0AE0AB